jgi:hypothetical protein
MIRKKFSIAILMIVSLALNTAGVSACAAEQTREGASGNEQSKSQTHPPQPAPVVEDKLQTNVASETKELAAGANGSIRESFVFVARDAETYARIRELNDKLPELGADFFKSNAVVAAFLGQRRSGGYRVHIERGASGLVRVSERPPPKDAIVTMAITAPFQIVSVGVREESPLVLELDATWQENTRPYRVDAGEFARMGGITGRPEKVSIKGDIRIMRHAQLATFFFALRGTSGEEGVHALQDTASGTITPEGSLSLTFEVTQAKVNDGYGGHGKLEATATAPPPKKRAVDPDQPM